MGDTRRETRRELRQHTAGVRKQDSQIRMTVSAQMSKNPRCASPLNAQDAGKDHARNSLLGSATKIMLYAPRTIVVSNGKPSARGKTCDCSFPHASLPIP